MKGSPSPILRLVALLALSIGILYSPFHAAAYLASAWGSESPPLVPWDAGFRAMAAGAFDFGGPDQAYLTYGKIGWIGLAGILLAATLVRSRASAAPPRAERIGHWILMGGASLVLLGFLVEYYTPFIDQGFMFLTAPGMLLLVAGHVTYGVGVRRSGNVPTAAAWIFLLAPLVLFAGISLLGHIPIAMVPIFGAWIGALVRTET